MQRPDSASPPDSEEVSQLLAHWREPEARDRLFALIYPELRRVAQVRMNSERQDHTLQPTALVNEVFLRMVRQESVSWQNRAHFLATASKMMRRILIDHARGRPMASRPRSAGLDIEQVCAGEGFSRILELDDLLDQLAEKHARAAQVVEMRYFGGLTFDEAAHVLGIDPRTAKRDWQLARAWLYTAISGEGNDSGPEA